MYDFNRTSGNVKRHASLHLTRYEIVNNHRDFREVFTILLTLRCPLCQRSVQQIVEFRQ